MTNAYSIRGQLFPVALRLWMQSRLKVTQAQRVCQHKDGTESHRGGGKDGVEQPAEERVKDACCQRDAEHVVGERPEEVAFDGAHGRAAQLAAVQASTCK